MDALSHSSSKDSLGGLSAFLKADNDDEESFAISKSKQSRSGGLAASGSGGIGYGDVGTRSYDYSGGMARGAGGMSGSYGRGGAGGVSGSYGRGGYEEYGGGNSGRHYGRGGGADYDPLANIDLSAMPKPQAKPPTRQQNTLRASGPLPGDNLVRSSRQQSQSQERDSRARTGSGSRERSLAASVDAKRFSKEKPHEEPKPKPSEIARKAAEESLEDESSSIADQAGGAGGGESVFASMIGAFQSSLASAQDARKKQEEDEAEAKRQAEELQVRLREEEIKAEEERIKAEEERKRKIEAEAEERRKQEAEAAAERRKLEEEARLKKLKDEEEERERRRKEKEEEEEKARKLKAEEEERIRKAAEEERQKRLKEEEEAAEKARKQKAEEDKRRLEEEEEEEDARQQAAQEAMRKQKEEEEERVRWQREERERQPEKEVAARTQEAETQNMHDNAESASHPAAPQAPLPVPCTPPLTPPQAPAALSLPAATPPSAPPVPPIPTPPVPLSKPSGTPQLSQSQPAAALAESQVVETSSENEVSVSVFGPYSQAIAGSLSKGQDFIKQEVCQFMEDVAKRIEDGERVKSSFEPFIFKGGRSTSGEVDRVVVDVAIERRGDKLHVACKSRQSVVADPIAEARLKEQEEIARKPVSAPAPPQQEPAPVPSQKETVNSRAEPLLPLQPAGSQREPVCQTEEPEHAGEITRRPGESAGLSSFGLDASGTLAASPPRPDSSAVPGGDEAQLAAAPRRQQPAQSREPVQLDGTSDSITLMASVRDSLTPLPKLPENLSHDSIGPLPSQQLQQGGNSNVTPWMHTSSGDVPIPHGFDRTGNSTIGGGRLGPNGVDDGSWLQMSSTESAEDRQKSLYWRAQQQRLGGLGSINLGTGLAGGPGVKGLDTTSSLLLGSTVLSDANLAGLLGKKAGATLRPDELQASLADGVVHRVDRAKLETLQAEIHGLKRKIQLLEEFNQELVGAKARAESQAGQVEEQVMRLRLENRKLQDGTTAYVGALREAAVVKDELERRLGEAQQLLAERGVAADAQTELVAKREEDLLARVRSLQTEAAGLREERDALREDLASVAPTLTGFGATAREAAEPRNDADIPASGAGPGDAARLQAELEMTERLLRGCEKENESLAAQNRQLRQSSRLRKEEVEGRQLQLVSELNAARASADTNPASQRRVSELEREVVLAKERADEHARELERCREAKRQLERELLNGCTPATEDGNVAKKIASAQDRCKEAEGEIAELKQRLAWYAESVRDMEEDRKEVTRLNEELRTLRAQNAELKRKPSAKEASRRNSELQKQVQELHECLRKRHPDSILSLVKACEPKPEERKELRELHGRVEELEAKLAEREVMYDRQVRALRANYDHLRHEYERRADGKTSNGTACGDAPASDGSAAPDREGVLQARIKDLERQVEHTKSYYLTKLRKREPLVPVQAQRPTSANIPGARARGDSAAGGLQQREREAELQRAIRERDARIEELSRTIHWRELNADEGAFMGGQLVRSSGAQLAFGSASMLRRFLAAPEALPVAALSSELRSMARAARARQYGEVVAQARSLLAVLCSEEAAAGAVSAAAAREGGKVGQDAFRFHAHPALPCAVWATWRRQTEQLAEAASEACRRAEEGIVQLGAPVSDANMPSDLATALAAMRCCTDEMLTALLRPAGGGGGSDDWQAWASEAATCTAVGALESVLPRLLVEGIREDIDSAGNGRAAGLLQDAEVHAGLDHRLPWQEMVGVLERCGIGGHRLLGDIRAAANPDWSFPVSDLRAPLMGVVAKAAGGSGGAPPTHAPCVGLLRALTRVRMAAGRSDPPLPKLFRRLDTEELGFVARGEFLEALRGLRCALTPEERGQLTSYFSPAIDPGWVCYPLFLQSITPLRGEAVPLAPTPPEQGAPAKAWDTGNGAHLGSGASAGRLEALAKISELETDNERLRRRVHTLSAKCADHAALVAQSPVQLVQRLQGEVAMLESRVLEEQTASAVEARKTEITLRAELDVATHEVSQLRRQLEAKDREVVQYQRELEGIIIELSELRPRSTVTSGGA